jgi:L-lactate dehydrogenase
MINYMKIGIIGCGHLGSTLAYTLAIKNLAREIALIDQDKNKAIRTALDLNQTSPVLGDPIFTAGGYEKLIDADIVVIAAGDSRKKEEESHFDLASANLPCVKEISEKIIEQNTNCILIVATNPVDLMTYVALKVTGFSKEKVIGLGTLIDTIRMRYFIAQKIKLNPRDINLIVIGVHGEAIVPLYSTASVGGVPLDKLIGFDDLVAKEVMEKTRKSGEKIISLGGTPAYAPAAAVALLIENIVYNTKQILPVSSFISDCYDINNTCFSLPAIIGNTGIEEVLIPSLDNNELSKLHESYEKLQAELDKLLATC